MFYSENPLLGKKKEKIVFALLAQNSATVMSGGFFQTATHTLFVEHQLLLYLTI